MKKDVEWLKEEIAKVFYYTEIKLTHAQVRFIFGDIEQLIDQLDEPEITENKAWKVIELENSYHLAPAHMKIYKEAIQNGVKPECFNEPQKPIIPQFIANWIESYRKKTLVELINDAVYSSDEDSQCFRRWFHEEMGFESNYDEFLSRVWLDGYTTEKEKLYRVRVGKSYVRFNLDGSIIGAKAVDSVVTLDHLSKLPFDYKKAVESGIITLVEVTE